MITSPWRHTAVTAAATAVAVGCIVAAAGEWMSFQWQVEAGTPGEFTDAPLALGLHQTMAVGLADLDGDSDIDALAVHHGALGGGPDGDGVWLNDGTGHFDDSGQRLGAAYGSALALGDVDGDGDLDAFVGNSGPVDGAGENDTVWLNNSRGRFTDSGQRLGGVRTRGVALGDVDADGDLDAVTVHYGSVNRVWKNNGHAAFTPAQGFGDNGRANCVALADVDRDGDLDAVVGRDDGPVQVWKNSGNAVFTSSGQQLGDWKVSALALADMDRDGSLDIVAGYLARLNGDHPPDRSFGVWLNDRLGRFSDSGQLVAGPPTTALAVADFDADGLADVFTAGIGQPLRFWRGAVGGRVNDSGQRLAAGASWALGAADFDGDVDVDVYEGSLALSDRVWVNNGGLALTPVATEIPTETPSPLPTVELPTPTPTGPTPTPTRSATPTRTATPTASSTFTPAPPTDTPDAIASSVAGTLTAQAPTATATPDAAQTAVAATLTALAPTLTASATSDATASATPSPTPTPVATPSLTPTDPPLAATATPTDPPEAPSATPSTPTATTANGTATDPPEATPTLRPTASRPPGPGGLIYLPIADRQLDRSAP